MSALCEHYSVEKLEEREEPRPRQPADLGPPAHGRSLLGLAERAEAAVCPGGPLERLAAAAVQQGGAGCTVEMGPVKGLRRCLQKAQEDYDGDYLRLNDVARCSIVVPKLSTLHECLR